MSTTTAEQHDTFPPIECTPWCRDGDGHTGVKFPRDQYCMSDDVRVTLTREKMVHCGEDRWELDDLRAYLVHDRFEVEPHVALGRNDLHLVSMTVEEARRFGEALVRFAEQTRGA